MTDLVTIIAKALYEHDNPPCPQSLPCGRKRPCPFENITETEAQPYISKAKAVVSAINTASNHALLISASARTIARRSL